MSTWVNNDGLFIKYGTTEAATKQAGEKTAYGQFRQTVLEIDWNDLEAFGTTTILSDTVTLPAGAHIQSAELYVVDAFVGATATLTLGLLDQDRSTAIDADGIDAAIAVTAIDADGDTIACDGALINTTLANTGLFTALVGTANFTAGKGRLTVNWYIPDA
jgi:hypothetical protein